MLPWSSVFSDKTSSILNSVESWISSIFFVLFLITIGPWFIFLAYDLLLYVWRTITYEIPIIGGRARGKERPRAPSLKERPGGDPRVIGIGVPGATYVEEEDLQEEERRMSRRNSLDHFSEQEAHQTGHGRRESGNTGFARDAEDTDEDEQPHQQRIFSIGGSDEKASWTEVNARRRMGFRDDGGPT